VSFWRQQHRAEQQQQQQEQQHGVSRGGASAGWSSSWYCQAAQALLGHYGSGTADAGNRGRHSRARAGKTALRRQPAGRACRQPCLLPPAGQSPW
jgi:hypothetical protein